MTAAPSISYNHFSTVLLSKIPCIIVVPSPETVGEDIRVPSHIQTFLKTNNLWWDFYNKYADNVRPIDNMISILSCSAMVKGYKIYHCSHIKTVCFVGKSHVCPIFGKNRRIYGLISKWQHCLKPIECLTLTIPDVLWSLSQRDRSLLNQQAKLATDVILEIAKKKKIKVAIFTAMYTFGRDLT
jgi:hypothetical protein